MTTAENAGVVGGRDHFNDFDLDFPEFNEHYDEVLDTLLESARSRTERPSVATGSSAAPRPFVAAPPTTGRHDDHANLLIDQFIQSGSCDRVDAFAAPLPARVFFGSFLGVPFDDLGFIQKAVDDAMRGKPDVRPAAWGTVSESSPESRTTAASRVRGSTSSSS